MLSFDIDADDTVIVVSDISGFPDRGTVQLDEEVLTYWGKEPIASGSALALRDTEQPGRLLHVERSASATAHRVGTPVILLTSTCLGDCDSSNTVTVDELVSGVNIALGDAPLSDCLSFDSSGDGKVTVDELVKAVNSALNGCGG